MRAFFSLSIWIIGFHLSVTFIHAGENGLTSNQLPISFHFSGITLNEQYIPESRQISIPEPETDSGKVLILIFPFFQEIWSSKNELPHSSQPQMLTNTLFNGIFQYKIIHPPAGYQHIHTFSASKGQDVVWYQWVSKKDTSAFLKRLQVEYKTPVFKELTINKSLSYIHHLGMSAVETGNILNKKAGMVEYSTTIDMKAGDCFMVIIPHQPFNPDSIKTKTVLYAREGIETKIYTDDFHLKWQYVDIGTGAFFIANVQHQQQFDADLSFEIYSKDKYSIPDASLLIVKKGAIRQARVGYDAKGLYQADEWHKFIQTLQNEYKEQQIKEQLKRKEELSNILSGRTFKLALQQNGQIREISSQPGSVIYQVNERFYLVMNAAMEYALLDMENPGVELQYLFTKAEYFPSIRLLALTGKHQQNGCIIHTESGQRTSGDFTKILVRNSHLYASTTNETIVFSSNGYLNRIPLSDKVLFESPRGQFFAVKHQDRGEVFTANKQRLTTNSHFFTQFGSVDDQGIILGRANQAMAAALNDPALIHAMHFYQFKNGQPVLVAKAGCTETQYLESGKLACKSNENAWYLYSLNGSRLQSQGYSHLDNLLASLQINKSNLVWNKELRPAVLKSALISYPEKADSLQISHMSDDVLGVFGTAENRIWVIRQ